MSFQLSPPLPKRAPVKPLGRGGVVPIGNREMRIRPWRRVAVVLLGGFTVGCAHHVHPVPPTRAAVTLAVASGLTAPMHDDQVQATAVPPVGWRADPLKSDNGHTHRVWISPTGDTAYGIIYFTLPPLPVNSTLVLWGFMNNMRSEDATATLISQQADDALPGIRFVAEDRQYRIRTNLVKGSFEGWAIYAGSLQKRPINWPELRSAIKAREQTRVDQ